MNWTAIVPLKPGRERKSRLAARLSIEERARLSDRMAAHVLARLAGAGVTARVLSAAPWPGVAWDRDEGAGLNAELGRLRIGMGGAPLLVIHGDLPLLESADVLALLAAAEAHGVAIAPDRHGVGSNAVAIVDGRPFAFAFGADSCARHLAAGEGVVLVRDRPGLSLDIDTPDDLHEAHRRGFA